MDVSRALELFLHRLKKEDKHRRFTSGPEHVTIEQSDITELLVATFECIEEDVKRAKKVCRRCFH
jgi:hypothetical protein